MPADAGRACKRQRRQFRHAVHHALSVAARHRPGLMVEPYPLMLKERSAFVIPPQADELVLDGRIAGELEGYRAGTGEAMIAGVP